MNHVNDATDLLKGLLQGLTRHDIDEQHFGAELYVKISQAIALLEGMGGDAVIFTCHGNSAPAYSCNKPGDMSGTYYTNPPTQTAAVPSAKIRQLFDVLRKHLDDDDNWSASDYTTYLGFFSHGFRACEQVNRREGKDNG